MKEMDHSSPNRTASNFTCKSIIDGNFLSLPTRCRFMSPQYTIQEQKMAYRPLVQYLTILGLSGDNKSLEAFPFRFSWNGVVTIPHVVVISRQISTFIFPKLKENIKCCASAAAYSSHQYLFRKLHVVRVVIVLILLQFQQNCFLTDTTSRNFLNTKLSCPRNEQEDKKLC